MKKFFSIITVAAMMASCGSQQKGYVVECKISGLPDSTMVQLVPVSHMSSKPMAEAYVKDGKFAFAGEVEQPTAVRITINEQYPMYDTRMMVANGEKCHLTANANLEQNGEKQVYALSDFNVENSPLTDQYRQLLALHDELDSLHAAFQERNKEALTAMNEAYAANDAERIKAVKETEAYQKVMDEEHEFFRTVEDKIYGQVLDNKDSYWGPLMLISHTSYLSNDQRDIYEQFSEEAKASSYGKMVFDELYPAGKVGSPVSKFEGKDINGNDITIEEVCKGKKAVILDFWASWCVPCRKEIPNIKEIYAKHHDSGLEIVSVSIDKDDAEWRKAVAEENLKWINIRDVDGSIAEMYKIIAVPTIYLLGPDGKLAADNLRGAELAAAVDSIMKQ